MMLTAGAVAMFNDKTQISSFSSYSIKQTYKTKTARRTREENKKQPLAAGEKNTMMTLLFGAQLCANCP